MADWKDTVAGHLGGESKEKPKKEIDHVVVKRSATKGDHTITHHHTHPEHHPSETHTTRGDDELAQHMMQNMGTPNQGEPEADAGTPDAASATAAPAAAPSPAGSGAQAPMAVPGA